MGDSFSHRKWYHCTSRQLSMTIFNEEGIIKEVIFAHDRIGYTGCTQSLARIEMLLMIGCILKIPSLVSEKGINWLGISAYHELTVNIFDEEAIQMEVIFVHSRICLIPLHYKLVLFRQGGLLTKMLVILCCIYYRIQ